MLTIYTQLKGFIKKVRLSPKIQLFGKSRKTFPASEPVKTSSHFSSVSMYVHVLQHRNIVTVEEVV
jgi:hypothetical protein